MHKLALVLLCCSGCAALKPKPETPVLAPVQSGPLRVEFLGTKPEVGALFVCGMMDPTKLSCVDYGYFQQELQKRAP
jgi:hypothetical protein